MKGPDPLGLPPGSVRALMALALIGVTVYLFGVQALVPTELLTLDGVMLTFYFTTRAAERTAQIEAETPVPDPYVPGVEG